MFVVAMPVFMLHLFVQMFVPVSFSQMEPNADHHQSRCGNESNRQSVSENYQ